MANSQDAMQDLKRILAERSALYARADDSIDTSAKRLNNRCGIFGPTCGSRGCPCTCRQLNSHGHKSTLRARGAINFATHPGDYQRWQLDIEGDTAWLTLDVNEDQTIGEGYALKLNSYDLGVDIELNDAVQRLRFEHDGLCCDAVG